MMSYVNKLFDKWFTKRNKSRDLNSATIIEREAYEGGVIQGINLVIEFVDKTYPNEVPLSSVDNIQEMCYNMLEKLDKTTEVLL
jgi:hypothetical protein